MGCCGSRETALPLTRKVATIQAGTQTVELNTIHVDAVRSAIKLAESIKGMPVNNLDIYKTLLEMPDTDEITGTI